MSQDAGSIPAASIFDLRRFFWRRFFYFLPEISSVWNFPSEIFFQTEILSLSFENQKGSMPWRSES